MTDEPHVTPPPASSVTFNLAEVLEYSARPLRIAGVVFAVLLVAVVGVLAWRTYGRAPPAATAAQGPQEIDTRGKNFEGLKASIQQLAAAQQLIAQDVAALKADRQNTAQDPSVSKDDQSGQKVIASQQADIQRLSDRLTALESKLDTLQKSTSSQAAPRSHDSPRRRAESNPGATPPPASRSPFQPPNSIPAGGHR